MSKVLILHASREGQTEHIAERLAEILRDDGHEVRLAPAAPFPGTRGADAVIIAASVHRGRHPYGLVRAVRAHRRVLEHMSSAFLSVCLCAAGSDPMLHAEADGYLHDFLQRTGWHPDLAASAAGALRFSRYGILQARLVRALVRRDGIDAEPAGDQEFTDWNDIRRFAEAFSTLVGEPSVRTFTPRRRAPSPG